MKSNKKNKLKILGFEFKSIDSFLITIYFILVLTFPFSFSLDSIYVGLSIIVAILIILSIITVYLILLIRMLKYNKTIEEKKYIFKKFLISNLIAFTSYLIYFLIAEVYRCINHGEACGLGLTLSIIFLFGPILFIIGFLVLLILIPLIIAKIKEKK